MALKPLVHRECCASIRRRVHLPIGLWSSLPWRGETVPESSGRGFRPKLVPLRVASEREANKNRSARKSGTSFYKLFCFSWSLFRRCFGLCRTQAPGIGILRDTVLAGNPHLPDTKSGDGKDFHKTKIKPGFGGQSDTYPFIGRASDDKNSDPADGDNVPALVSDGKGVAKH